MSQANSISSDSAAASELKINEQDVSDQYLTFIIAQEEYGVDILCVQEIRGWDNATPIPNAPEHVKGVINLRGTIIPVIDLRTCFGLGEVEYTAVTVVIVLKVKNADKDRTIGIIVDAVSDVFSLDAADLKPAPDIGDAHEPSCIKGIANINKKMVVLLEINNLLNQGSMPDFSALDVR